MKNKYTPHNSANLIRCCPVLRIINMILLACAMWIMPASCDNADLWNEVPGEIAEFVNNYYPMSRLQSFSHSDQTYHLRIENGPGMTFNNNYNWITVDGYGMPLPQVMLFDQLPPALYNYLQETERLDAVFSINHNTDNKNDSYTAELIDTSVSYDVITGKLTGTIPDDGNES
ncbi:MAG: hypothetical protein K2I69_08170 [Muribaculaceae bacterium]|nr:hypothetical protein [Muribaculaceae bacterium]